MENPIGYFGVIQDTSSETDYQLVAGSVDLPNPRHTFEENKIQYNQSEVQPYSCSLHGTLGAVSDLSGVKFTLEQRKSLLEQALKLGFDPTIGWYIKSAVDLVRKNASVWLKEELVTYRVDLCSDEFWAGINKGYSFTVGFSGNADYFTDRLDGVLDLVKNEKPPTFGHCVRICKSQQPGMVQLIVDNYIGASVNLYTIPEGHLVQLLKNGVFFKNAYVFAFKQDVSQPPSLVSPWAVSSVEKAKKHGITNWDTPKQVVGDAILEAMLVKVGLLTSTMGNVTKERFAVAMDRAKLLD